MKKISDLIIPSLDAVDYRAKEKKKFFTESYNQTSFLKKAKSSNCYYFVGEKGTGKTALAFYVETSSPDGISAKLLSISETQYVRFIKLKQKGKLDYTDYTIIWRATLLYLMAKLAIEKQRKWHHKLNGKFKKIEAAIEKYDSDSHIPDLEYVIEFVSSLTSDAGISAEIPEVVNGKINQNRQLSETTNATKIKLALLECERILKSAFTGVKLTDDLVLFLDGLDTKPSEVEHAEFQKCLVGLSEAAWQLNSEYFANLKDSPGRMRCVLLLRPDVFDSLNLHNSNCKLADNSVLLEWHTTDDRHLSSDIYKASSRYFTAQNEGRDLYGWNEYFQEKSKSSSDSFKTLLKSSFHRPRDIMSAVRILINLNNRYGSNDDDKFAPSVLNTAKFTDEYSEYLLGEVKNYANYYITNSEFELITSFFQNLHGNTEFNYTYFKEAYLLFLESHGKSLIGKVGIISSPESFLQFLYDINVIGYSETSIDTGVKFWHWSFRERSSSKIMPRIKENADYKIHPGIAKSLNIGKSFAK